MNKSFNESAQDYIDSQIKIIREMQREMPREMPKYRSHKEVWALKIKSIEFDQDEYKSISADQEIATITPEEEGYGPFRVDFAYCNKHNPKKGGYYVVYKDGYRSFSPAKEFEEGNTLIREANFIKRIIDEKCELDLKAAKLEQFLTIQKASEKMSIDPKQFSLLEIQLGLMQAYSSVLHLRLIQLQE